MTRATGHLAPLLCALALLSLACFVAGSVSPSPSPAPGSCGCSGLESDGINYGDEGCCRGHTSLHVGDFSPFMFNESAPYAALGSVRAQFYSTVPHVASPLFETVIIVDPPRKIMYQSGVGYQGSGTWYFPNGTYLVLPVSDGPYQCLYSSATFDDEVALYADSMFLGGSTTPRSDVDIFANAGSGGARCAWEQNQCTRTRTNLYSALTLDTTSCEQRIMSTYTVQADTNWVTSMLVVFPTQPLGVTTIIEAFFNYYDFAPVNSTSWATVPDLPASCAAPLDLCSTLYPNGPYFF